MSKLEEYKIKEEPKDILEFVSAVITNKQGNVLILKRKKDLKLDPGKYDLCSGHMKQGEVNPIFTMLRELEEEINLKLEQINSIEEIGTIPTPMKQFSDTKCHMYHVMINISEEQLNQMVKEVEKPEVEEVIFLEDFEVLKDLQKNSNICRTGYNEDFEEIYKKIELKIKQNNTKEEKCEER